VGRRGAPGSRKNLHASSARKYFMNRHCISSMFKKGLNSSQVLDHLISDPVPSCSNLEPFHISPTIVPTVPSPSSSSISTISQLTPVSPLKATLPPHTSTSTSPPPVCSSPSTTSTLSEGTNGHLTTTFTNFTSMLLSSSSLPTSSLQGHEGGNGGIEGVAEGQERAKLC
jgi:hypothetical protein